MTHNDSGKKQTPKNHPGIREKKENDAQVFRGGEKLGTILLSTFS